MREEQWKALDAWIKAEQGNRATYDTAERSKDFTASVPPGTPMVQTDAGDIIPMPGADHAATERKNTEPENIEWSADLTNPAARNLYQQTAGPDRIVPPSGNFGSIDGNNLFAPQPGITEAVRSITPVDVLQKRWEDYQQDDSRENHSKLVAAYNGKGGQIVREELQTANKAYDEQQKRNEKAMQPLRDRMAASQRWRHDNRLMSGFPEFQIAAGNWDKQDERNGVKPDAAAEAELQNYEDANYLIEHARYANETISEMEKVVSSAYRELSPGEMAGYGMTGYRSDRLSADGTAGKRLLHGVKARTKEDFESLGRKEPQVLMRLASIEEKASKGEKLTEGEKALVSAWLMEQDAQTRLESLGGATNLEKAGRMVGENIPFLLEMATSGVLGGAVAGAARGLMRKGITAGIRAGIRNRVGRYVTKQGANILGSMVGGAATAPLSNATWSDFARRDAGQYDIGQGADGEIEVVKSRPESLALRTVKSLGTGTAELGSEYWGGFAGAGRLLPRALRGTRVAQFTEPLRQLINTPSVQRLNRYAGNIFKWNGLSMEYAEEQLNNIVGPLLAGEPERIWENFTSEAQMETLLGVVAMGGVFQTVGTGAAAYDHIRSRQRSTQLLGHIQDPELRRQVSRAMGRFTQQQQAKAISNIEWENASLRDMAAATDYIVHRTQGNATKAIQDAMREQAEAKAAVERFEKLKNRDTGKAEEVTDTQGNRFFLAGGTIEKSGEETADGTVFVIDPVSEEVSQKSVDELRRVKTTSYEEFEQEALERIRTASEAQAEAEALEDIMDDAAAADDDPTVRAAEYMGINLDALEGRTVTLASGEQAFISSVAPNPTSRWMEIDAVPLNPETGSTRVDEKGEEVHYLLDIRSIKEVDGVPMKRNEETADGPLGTNGGPGQETFATLETTEKEIPGNVAEAESPANADTENAVSGPAEPMTGVMPVIGMSEQTGERDENGLPFVKAANGTTIFGEIREESGLSPAPIRLSEGFQDENGKGYGLAHIEANHGKQIRNAGFSSVEDFVTYVATNYDEDNIRVGKRRYNGNTTYLLQVTDAHDNTLFIELSRDGTYWNVNSAGIFRKGYSNKKETVVKTEPRQPNNAVSTGSSLSEAGQEGITSSEPNGKPTVSYPKNTNSVPPKQEIPQKKNGTPDYAAMEPDAMFRAIAEDFGEDVALEEVARQINIYEDKIKKLSASRSEDINVRLANRNKIKELQAKTDALRDAVGIFADADIADAPQSEAVTGKRTTLREQSRALGDYLSAEDKILRDIAEGLKFRWSDNGTQRGLGTELGFSDSPAERKTRFNILSNDGTTVDRYAESLEHDMDNGIIPMALNTDLRSAILDVLGRVRSNREAFDAAMALREDDPRNSMTEEEARQQAEYNVSRSNAVPEAQQKQTALAESTTEQTESQLEHKTGQDTQVPDFPFRRSEAEKEAIWLDFSPEHRQAVEEIVAELNQKLGENVVVFAELEELPEKVRDDVRKTMEDGYMVQGLTFNQVCYLYAPAITDKQTADYVYTHELAGHKNVEAAFPDRTSFAAFCDRLVDDIGVSEMAENIDDTGFIDCVNVYFAKPDARNKYALGREYIAYLTKNSNARDLYEADYEGDFSLPSYWEFITTDTLNDLIHYANSRQGRGVSQGQGRMGEQTETETGYRRADGTAGLGASNADRLSRGGQTADSGRSRPDGVPGSGTDHALPNAVGNIPGRASADEGGNGSVGSRGTGAEEHQGSVSGQDDTRVDRNQQGTLPTGETVDDEAGAADDIRFRRAATKSENSAYEAEVRSIIEKAKANGTYLKAPNGKSTRLTERQWTQVRTRAFKNWFGNWEANAEIEAMQSRIGEWLSKENLEWAEGKSRSQIVEKFGNKPQPVAYIPEKFLSVLDENLTDNRVYSGRGYFIDHAVNHHPGIAAEKYRLIQDTLSDPDEIKAIEGKGKKSVVFVKQFDRYNAVVIELEKSDEGKIIWHKSFYDQKKKPYANKGIRLFESSEGGVSSIIRTGEPAHGSILPALGDTSKIQTNIVSPNNNVSKVVDENGEPLVVFHGTDARFTRFDPSEMRDREGSFFFAENREDAESYSDGTIMPVFINVRKPFDYENGAVPDEYREHWKQARNKREQVAILKKVGFDGWTADFEHGNGWGEISVFYPSQIKPATDNTGEFSAENDDIRFRRAYHGSGADFDRFDHSFMGTGEGAQDYGWGTYVTEVGGIARSYAETGTGQDHNTIKDAGLRNLYTVEIPDDTGTNYIRWDGPADAVDKKEIAEKLTSEVAKDLKDDAETETAAQDIRESLNEARTGGELYGAVCFYLGNEDASRFLSSLGFAGIEYPAGYTTDERVDGAKNYVIFNAEDVKITDHVRFRNMAEANAAALSPEQVNERFNEELRRQIDGTLPKSHIYRLGRPGEALRAAGVPDLPIELSAARLAEKASPDYTNHHPFALEEVENLPQAMQHPVAIFDSKTQPGSKVVLTELQHNGTNFVVAIKAATKKTAGRRVIEINSIRSVYPKDYVQDIVNWINREDLLRWADKEKLLSFLDQQRNDYVDAAFVLPDKPAKQGKTEAPIEQAPNRLGKQQSNSADVAIPVEGLSVATNIIKNLANPSLAEGKKYAAAQNMADELGVKVRIVRSRDEISGEENRFRDKRGASGWHDRRTGEIAVVLPNCRDAAEVQKTILHEAVGHYGIPELLGRERADELYRRVFDAVKDTPRAQELLAEHSGDKTVAGDEYLAEMAEGDVAPSIWKRIMAAIRGFFRDSLGIDLRLTDADMRYILWRSKNNLQRARTVGEAMETIGQDIRMRAQTEHESARERKAGQLEKLRRSEPLRFTGEEYKGLYELNPQSATRYMLDNIRGEYVNADSGEKIQISRKGAKKTTGHDLDRKVHLQSVAYIPQMLENAILIDEMPNVKSSTGFDSYQYYVCSLNIGGTDYTAKVVVGVSDRTLFYDHALTEIEKGKLIEGMGSLRRERTDEKSPDFSIVKDKRLLSILQPEPLKYSQESAKNTRPEPQTPMQYLDRVAEEMDAQESEIRFRRKKQDPAADAPTRITKDNWATRIGRKLQDAHIPVRQLQDYIREQGGTVGIDNDLYSALNRALGRQMERIRRADAMFAEVARKMRGIQQDYRYSYDQIEEYLAAKSSIERHASGVNAYSEKADAPWNKLHVEKTAADFERVVSARQVAELWKEIRKITELQLEMMRRYGLISVQTVRDIRARGWQYYMPLQGIDHEFEQKADPHEIFGEILTERRGGRSSLTHRAEGRTTRPDDVLATLQQNVHQTIMVGEQNLARQFLLRLAEANPKFQGDTRAGKGIFEIEEEWWVRRDSDRITPGERERGEVYERSLERPADSEIEQSQQAAAEKRKLEQELEQVEKKLWKLDFENADNDELSALLDRRREFSEQIEKTFERITAVRTLPRGGHAYRGLSTVEEQTHTVAIYRNGVRTIVRMSDPIVAQAINGNFKELFGGVMANVVSASGKGTRWMASTSTSWNPEFLLKNTVRDSLWATFYNWVDKDGSAKGYLRNYPAAQKAIVRYHTGKARPLTLNERAQYNIYTPEGAAAAVEAFGLSRVRDAWFDDFLLEGGLTGYAYMQGVSDYGKKLARKVRWMSSRAGNALHDLREAMETVNDLSEVTTRFATFLSQIQKGSDVRTAVNYARDVTINFNRRGEWGRDLNSLYMFYNAATQGIANFYNLTRRNKARMGFAIAATLGLGYATSLLLAQFLAADDDDEEWYISDYLRYTNLCLPGWIVGSDDKAVLIPLPQELRPVWVAGVVAADVTQGRIDAKDAWSVFVNAAGTVAEAAGEAFLPVEVSMERPMKTFVPSVFKPLYELYANADFTGYPIYREPFTQSLEGRIPDSQLGMRNANKLISGAAEWLNEKGGGNKWTPAGVDPTTGKVNKLVNLLDQNPSKWEHAITSYTGGLGRMGARMYRYFASPEEERIVNDIPFIRTFLTGARREINPNTEYYDIRQKYESLDYWARNNWKNGEVPPYYTSPEEANRAQQETAIVMGMIKESEKQLKALKKQMETADADSPEHRKLARQMTEVRRNFINEYNQFIEIHDHVTENR